MSQEKLTKQQLMKRWGESAKQIERFVKEGIPCSGEGHKRRFHWPACQKWRDDRTRRLAREAAQREREQQKPKNLDDARSRKEVALANKAELEVEQMRGELIPRAVHEQRVEMVCKTLAAKVKGLGRYIPDVQRATSDVDAQLVLEKIENDLLHSLHSGADDIEAEADAIADAEPTEQEHAEVA